MENLIPQLFKKGTTTNRIRDEWQKKAYVYRDSHLQIIQSLDYL